MNETSSATLKSYRQMQLSVLYSVSGCFAGLLTEENLFEWSATILGPYETPCEGGVFELRLKFPATYPQAPPGVRFISEVYHPNVSTRGEICADIFRNAWSPCNTVSSILASIQSLLNDPNPLHPKNPVAAQLYISDRIAYNKKVRVCAEKTTELAGPSSTSQQ
ncbi:hypothetical protein BRADI_1g57620v3 [Brachypodium distachyon]|uniref:UBC core domain-containing protein n=1 Tax=Brachypodium distachyon TaxID=15368 RepID=I1H3S9_BRADI|nr:hypothetical protein BRADI_1g57620v3 [Brachypodium distachyon]